MSGVRTYAVNCNDAWLNTDGDDISGSYVKYADYIALATKLDLAERACAAMAAENAELKSKGREVLNEACKVYDKFNANVDSDSGDFMDGQTLHEFQFVLDVETPATDAFLAEIERKAIRKFINSIEHILRDKLSPYDTEEMLEAMRIFLEEHGVEQ
ncbi:hypothetical protein IIE45_004551 [Salmonella enterica]|nr:hypothetical protein [Salmonella enterica]